MYCTPSISRAISPANTGDTAAVGTSWMKIGIVVASETRR